MKTFIPLAAIITGALFLSLCTTSCSKSDEDHSGPKEQLIARKWSINRIQLKLYSGSTFVKDTILKQTPHPQNFVTFGTDGSFEYRFNTTTSDLGTYTFKGADSVIASSAPGAYRWKMLTITDQLFTVMSTSSNDPNFPGYKVERYQTFVP